jgi:hypothetical protein
MNEYLPVHFNDISLQIKEWAFQSLQENAEILRSARINELCDLKRVVRRG